MHQFDEEKKQRFNIMFFSLKIIALFFCSAPIIKNCFFGDIDPLQLIVNGLTMMSIIMTITFMWILINRKHKHAKIFNYIEITLFYLMCVVAICYSGMHESYYKYVFIFVIVVYTIEAGLETGLLLSGLCSLSIMLIDIFAFKEPGINPYFESDISLSAMFFVVSFSLGYYVKLETENIADLKNAANMDGLTNAYNHKYFHERLNMLFKNDPDCTRDLSIIMIDIDYFKIYNDLFGHQQGDIVLQGLSKILTETVGSENEVCRYGGEEFTIIFNGLSESETMLKADIIRKRVISHNFPGKELLPGKSITISIGVSGRKGVKDTPMELINRADTALYRAKFFRKNRVELYSSVFEQFHDYDIKSQEQITSVKSLLTIINSRDHYTYNHTERVVQYCECFANYMNLGIEDRKKLYFGAYMHDVGKINIPKEILMSDSALSPEEWLEIRRHPEDGADIIKPFSDLADVIPIVLQHHERYDGSGYPNGLAGEKITYLARVLSLADSFDAMTTSRPYQRTKTFKEAFEDIRINKGRQFDPDIAEQFISAVTEACVSAL